MKELADELGYIPNNIGRSLSTNKTFTIGVIVPQINHSFFSTVIEEMYTKASNLGYQIILMISFEDEEKELAHVKTLLSMNVDGILIDTASSSSSNKAFSLIKKHKVPLLFFDRKYIGSESPGVYFDDYQLSYQLTTQLLGKGYSQLMYITGSDQVNINRLRLKGFIDAMRSQEMEVPENWILHSRLTEKGGYESFKSYLETEQPLAEAVLCVNDSIALGVYGACKEKNIRIPEELGVVGFGNVMTSSLVSPSLSTIDLRIKPAAAKAIENLVFLIGHEQFDMKDEFFAGEILFRDSTKYHINQLHQSGKSIPSNTDFSYNRALGSKGIFFRYPQSVLHQSLAYQEWSASHFLCDTGL